MILMLLGCVQDTAKPVDTYEFEDTPELEDVDTGDTQDTEDSDTGELEDTSSPSDDEISCDEGIAYLESCEGTSLTDRTCTEALYQELELVQYLSCDTFLNAKEGLPLCQSLGINCPESYQGCAAAPLDASEVLSVLQWTDNLTLYSIDQVAERNANLRFLFGEHGDIRGAFASVYSPITDAAVDSIQAGDFTHDEWVRDLVIDFAARYY